MKNKKNNAEIQTKLYFVGIGSALAESIITHFHEETSIIEEILEKNPYRLMQVDGISFIRADNIAKACGIENPEDPRRQRALIEYILDQNTSFGHSYLPPNVLKKKLQKSKITNFENLLKDLERENSIIIDDRKDIFLKKYFDAEVGIAASLKERKEQIFKRNLNISVEDYHDLDDFQKQALCQINQNLIIITGGPGCGKSYLTNRICQILDTNHLSYLLCAPTGKAAKRLQEMTSRQSSTIHRMLGASLFGSWKYNKENKRTTDYIIVDESSMIDIDLAWRLFQSFKKETSFILIGDVDQLPPVGPGSFFKDLISSKMFPSFYLRKNHRQGKGSLIAETAIAINRGAQHLHFGDDLRWIEAANPIIVREKVMTCLDDLIKLNLSFDKFDIFDDIQILTPQKATIIGTNELNKLIRFKLNPSGSKSANLDVGDKVMQTTNDYTLNLFNGFIGKIIENKSNHYLIYFYDNYSENPENPENPENLVIYPKSKKENLLLAFATTIHRFQGSETKCGIVVCSSSHTFMLTRNLIYTAITRFKEKCIIIGDRLGLKRAVTNTREMQRYSKLLSRLRS